MGGLPINKKFFSSWNPEMSYVLGFTVADGCIGLKRIRKRDDKKIYYFNITTKDRDLLENIKKAFGAKQKIYSKNSGSKKEKIYYFIQISYQEICKDLIRLGIHPRKTYNLGPIKIPDKYFPDFARGFFDGDGSVYIYNVNNTPQIKAGFVSPSFDFIKDFNNKLCNLLGINKKSIHKELPTRKNQKLIGYSISFYIDDCKKLYKFMYGNNPKLYLNRKKKSLKNGII